MAPIHLFLLKIIVLVLIWTEHVLNPFELDNAAQIKSLGDLAAPLTEINSLRRLTSSHCISIDCGDLGGE